MINQAGDQRGPLKVTVQRERIHIGERFSVSFQRTLRIPDDGRTYPLPPGLGIFPLFAVNDYFDRVTPAMREQGGAFIPMYQREALWLGFDAAEWKPNAIKIATGRINALSGQPFDSKLRSDPQDYLVCPEQPWLDGNVSGEGAIRQFVAMPLGERYTVESGISGAERFGGIQITVFEPKPGVFPETEDRGVAARKVKASRLPLNAASIQNMGLGAGGVMKQKVYPDPYGIDTWDQTNYGSVVVHIVNSRQFRELTGFDPPATPVSAESYTEQGFPWFDLYDESRGNITAPSNLRDVKTIRERDLERGEAADGDDPVDVHTEQIVKLDPDAPRPKRQPGPKSRSNRPKSTG